MAEALAQLVDSLLFEGYALYPYTPQATKNATPTPFGIVYPLAYAVTLESAYDHLELRCALAAPAQARLRAQVRFLAPDGRGRRARPQSLELPAVSLGALAERPQERRLEVAGPSGLRVMARLALEPIAEELRLVSLRVENRTAAPARLDRAGALARSLLATTPVVSVDAGAFLSPLERAFGSVNTFPVLATDDDRAVVGASIVLPDHPQIAPESRGGLFDSTEIEEALLLHVLALSDEERAAIERDDELVRAMVARAASVTPKEILALHGRMSMRDAPAPRPPETLSPPVPPADLADPTLGEEEAVVDGARFRRGGRVLLRPGPDADLHARLLDGRSATIERIFVDYDGRVHLGVTVDGDPGQQLMRETSRFLFFFAPEVEVLSP